VSKVPKEEKERDFPAASSILHAGAISGFLSYFACLIGVRKNQSEIDRRIEKRFKRNLKSPSGRLKGLGRCESREE
jgi:hypothetical protein